MVVALFVFTYINALMKHTSIYIYKSLQHSLYTKYISDIIIVGIYKG